MNYKGKKVVIMGLGNYKDGSGISAALFYAKREADLLITDLKNKKEFGKQINRLKKYKNIKYVLGHHRAQDFLKANFVFKNPSVPQNSSYLAIARKNKIPVVNDWSLFLKERPDVSFIGVTGTRGKSTTATLLFNFIKAVSVNGNNVFLCGNIGRSPLVYLNKTKNDDTVVAELSSWLLHEFKDIKKSPSLSIITNLMPDHLDKYESLKKYYQDKEYIFRFQKPGDCLILNRDNKDTRSLRKKAKSQVFWFSKKIFPKDNGVYADKNFIFFRDKGKEEKICSIKNIKIIGEHNLENSLAAVCGAMVLKIDKDKIASVLAGFTGVSNRLELVADKGGVIYYNDTTSTMPHATIAGLNALKKHWGKIILIAGGVDKKMDYKNLAKIMRRSLKALVLFKGIASDKILKEFENSDIGHSLKIGNCPPACDFVGRRSRAGDLEIKSNISSMRQAVLIAQELAAKSDIILLSPAAASFNLFKNEFDRGGQFVKFVKNSR